MSFVHQSKPVKLRAQFFGPVVLLSIVALAVLAFSGLYLVNRFDATAQAREEQMIAHGIVRKINDFSAKSVPQVNWDDAVANLDRTFDPAWADQNIAGFLHTMSGVSDAFVVDAAGHPIYASHDGRRTSITRFSGFSQAVTSQLGPIRQAEARRGKLRSSASSTEMISAPIQQAGLVAVGGETFVVSSSLVQPDFGTIMPSERAPVVVTAMPVNQVFLGQVADRYMLTGLELHRAGSNEAGHASIALRNVDGVEVARLAWEQQRPGLAMLGRLGLPIAAATLIFIVLALSFARRAAQSASDLISSEARARHLAQHDALTQLPNRALMFERLRQIFAAARRKSAVTALHCLDLDRFKEVNDTLGHNAGDELIQEVARRLMRVCRESDTVARLGGDEFVILQPNSDAAGASHLTERVFEALREPFDLEYGTVEIGCSIGVTLISGGDVDAGEALRQADLALYRSKDAGRMRATFFEPEMDAALRMRRALETDLRAAIATDGLSLVYQPQVDQHGTIKAVEALLRWIHPDRGSVAPGVFVPLAEETGLILDLGEYVFRRVFAETAEWEGLRIAINVSPIQLRSTALVPMLSRLIKQCGIHPAKYEIELTETALLGDDLVTRRNIGRLKKLGFTIALDDFGTGYSSLSVLQRFSVDTIKIDRSFVKNLEASEESEALVDAMIKLARALDLNVIAEGVETEAQKARLAACGCQDFQGFLIGKPLSASELRRLLPEPA